MPVFTIVNIQLLIFCVYVLCLLSHNSYRIIERLVLMYTFMNILLLIFIIFSFTHNSEREISNTNLKEKPTLVFTFMNILLLMCIASFLALPSV